MASSKLILANTGRLLVAFIMPNGYHYYETMKKMVWTYAQQVIGSKVGYKYKMDFSCREFSQLLDTL